MNSDANEWVEQNSVEDSFEEEVKDEIVKIWADELRGNLRSKEDFYTYLS